MPALVKSNVGSLAGTSDDECTRLCPLLSKKHRNFSRISEPVSIVLILAGGVFKNRCHPICRSPGSPIQLLFHHTARSPWLALLFTRATIALQCQVSARSVPPASGTPPPPLIPINKDFRCNHPTR